MAIAEPVDQVDIMELKSEDGRLVFRVTSEGQLIFGPDFGAADAAKHFVQFVNKIMDERDQHVVRENTELRKTILGHLKGKGELRRIVEYQKAEMKDLTDQRDELHTLIEKKCG